MVTPRLTEHERLVESFELDLSDFTDALTELALERECFDVPTRTKQLINRVVSTHSRRLDSEQALEVFLRREKHEV